jgi:hypothetical protein
MREAWDRAVDWWQARTGRARVWILLALAVVLVMAAGVAYLQPNRLVFSGERAVAEVIESDPGPPASMTVQFTTDDGEVVQAQTSDIFALPPVGAVLPVRYDPNDPSIVADDLYREPSTMSTVLVAAFAVVVGAAFVTWRNSRAERRAHKKGWRRPRRG